MISDPEHVLICAVERVLPRHTYLVLVIAAEVRRRWLGLSPRAKELVEHRIAEALAGGPHIWPTDRMTWESLLSWCRTDGGRKVE